MICKQNPCTAIANSIAEAITESKRTILLLSPSYVEGEWPEFEVQCALKESLRRNHRIIPIVHEPLDDVKQELSATLQHITDFITCLSWPTEEMLCNEKPGRLQLVVNRVKTQLFAVKNDDVDLRAAREDDFWKRLLLSLPKRKKDSEMHKIEDADEEAVTSLQSQTSLQSTTSETHELVRVSRTEKSNLFNRSYFDHVRTGLRPKAVQIVRPQPRQAADVTDNTSRPETQVDTQDATVDVAKPKQEQQAHVDTMQQVSKSSSAANGDSFSIREDMYEHEASSSSKLPKNVPCQGGATEAVAQ